MFTFVYPYLHIVTKLLIMEKHLIESALRIMRENFSIRELADLTGTDYRTMCAIMSGRQSLPLKMAFFVLDYLGCRCFIFRNC